mmetsp:Transcript_38073/g.69889  ORF Transcript_38073/g.69889 Transcript_38073/m.69889 type:complete len:561 (-) Transcript_38073:2759-4441(-)
MTMPATAMRSLPWLLFITLLLCPFHLRRSSTATYYALGLVNVAPITRLMAPWAVRNHGRYTALFNVPEATTVDAPLTTAAPGGPSDATQAAAAESSPKSSPKAASPQQDTAQTASQKVPLLEGVWVPPSQNVAQRRGKIFSIQQPQDLLDFVIQDERLSVVKVYASWCKTCAVFDIRYRKLASQLGDTHTSTKSDSKLVSSGRARFAEMQFDDPNNEEMCRLLNATKLPYILIYKGSKGKVADFQCGPAKFQMLLDAVNEYADAEGSVAGVGDSTAAGGNVGGEQEWNVVREQQQKQQQATRYGGANSIVNYPSSDDASKLQQKEAEITRLYTELSALRTDFDRRIVLLKETNSKETSTLNERIRAQTTEFENERRALSKQIEELSREMMDREKSLRANENAGNEQLQGEMKQKEEDYKMTLTGLNLRIGELQQDLFKSRNELQYNSNASSNDQLQLREHISNVETEMTNLKSRNQELERELIEEKKMDVASTWNKSRVQRTRNVSGSNSSRRRRKLFRLAFLNWRMKLMIGIVSYALRTRLRIFCWIIWRRRSESTNWN